MFIRKAIKSMFLLTSCFLLVSSLISCSQKQTRYKCNISTNLLEIKKKPPYPKTKELIGQDTAKYILKIEKINNEYTLNIKAIRKILKVDYNETKN